MASPMFTIKSIGFNPILLREEIEEEEEFQALRETPLEKATLCVERKILSVNAASLVFDTSRMKIVRALKAKSVGRDIGRRGRPTFLSHQQELDLVAQLKGMDCTKYPTRHELMSLAMKIVFSEDRQDFRTITYSWTYSFLVRHREELRTIYPRTIEHERILNRESMSSWFETHTKLLSSIKPQLLCNFDESMVAPGKRRFKVVCPKDQKRVVSQMVGNDEHITLLQFVWANGTASTPGLVLPLVHLPHMPDELAMKFHWAGQINGWIDDKIFIDLISNVFIP
jgi:hypothetical protein